MTPPRTFAPLDFAQLIAIAVIWGVNNIAAKIAVDALPPMLTAALRFGLVLVALIPWIKPPPRARLKPLLAMLMLVGPLHFGLQYVGLSMAHDLAPMVVAMQLWAPSSVVFAALVLGERVGALRAAGVALAFAGVAGMTFDPAVFAQAGALALVAVAACCYGLGAVLVRRIGGGVDPWAMQAWLALATVPALGAGSLVLERGHVAAVQSASWLVWACVAFGAIVSTIVANAFMFRLVQKYEVSRTTPYLLLSPLVAFGLSALVLGDRITGQIMLGAAATLAGVALVALAERRFKPV